MCLALVCLALCVVCSAPLPDFRRFHVWKYRQRQAYRVIVVFQSCSATEVQYGEALRAAVAAVRVGD